MMNNTISFHDLGSAVRTGILDRKFTAKFGRSINTTRYEQLRALLDLGYWPEISQPTTFNEKILNRMLNAEDELFTIATDKIASREYVTERWGSDILPEIYQITNDPERISFQTFPDSYLVKCSFGSGRIIFVEDVAPANESQIIQSCNEWLSEDDYSSKAIVQGHYNFDYNKLKKNKKVFVEERLVGYTQDIPRDYKFYVFHGDVEYVHVDSDRFKQRTMRFFDRDWNAMEFQKGGNPLGPVIDKPPRYDQMIEIAETLGEEFDFIRVDLYHTRDDRVLFGELTPNPGAGKSRFDPKRIDEEFGKLW